MSGSATRRDAQKQETRARILEAAGELLMSEGIEGFSMRKLAAKIGYTATAIYFHFPDKDALIAEIVDNQFLAFNRNFDKLAAIGDPVERLRKMAEAYVDFSLRHPEHYTFLFLTPAVNVLPRGALIQRGNPAQDGYARLKATIAEGLAARRYRDELRDADQLAQIVWASIHGLVALHIVRGADKWVDWAAPRPTARLLIDAMLRGIVRTDARTQRERAES